MSLNGGAIIKAPACFSHCDQGIDNKRLFYNKTVKFALPFLIFIIGGSLGLQKFTSLRYKYRNVDIYNPREEAKKFGVNIKNSENITLETQYEELQKMDINSWYNIRIQRPKHWND